MAFKKIEMRPSENDYQDILAPKTTMEQVIDPSTGLNMYVTLGMHTMDDGRHFTTADRTKLVGIATGANNYTHPTTAGNKHVPTGGATGQFLGYGGSSGTATWLTPPNDQPMYKRIQTFSQTGDGVTLTQTFNTNGKKKYKIIGHMIEDQNTASLIIRVNGKESGYTNKTFSPYYINVQDGSSTANTGYADESTTNGFRIRCVRGSQGHGSTNMFEIDLMAGNGYVFMNGNLQTTSYYHSILTGGVSTTSTIANMTLSTNGLDGYEIFVYELV